MDRSVFSYRFGSAEFDESRFELRVAGLPVEVEHRALEVLVYLLRHAGEVVTKEELLREVWAGRVTVDKVLPNAINKLRRAIGETNAGLISTQARVGYRLDGVVTRTAVGRQPDSELALGPGQPVPGRPSFVLQRQLGRTGGSEVWLAEHPKTRETRVYKFGLDGDRLRALKREVTLLRVLQEGASDPTHFVEVIDWNFESTPFFIECKHGGETLSDWASIHLAAMDVLQRLALFLQVADAVAAAHSLGVLHKDLKPANVLVTGDVQAPVVRLTDFGSGHLLEPDHLERLGITRLGMTVDDRSLNDSSSGTPLYLAPELFGGQAPTVKSDVFSLGIILYQLLAGRLGQPMVSGWESDISDELLREDLRLATDGHPGRRLANAADLASRLRSLEARRDQADRAQQEQAAARRDREALARTQARRPYMRLLMGVLVLGVTVAMVLLQQALEARNQARLALERANALARFLNEDLIGRSNPLVSAKGPDATLREVLLSARDRVATRFAAQPHTQAVIHASLGALFEAVDLMPEAESEARKSIEMLGRHAEASGAAALQARAVLVRVLSRQSRLDDAQQQFDELARLGAKASTPMAMVQIAWARSALLVARGDYAQAVKELRAALDGVPASEPVHTALRDALRLDLITWLPLAGQEADALAEGKRLIAEAERRPENSDLLVALVRLALARSFGEDHDAAQRFLLQAQPVIIARLGENHSRHLRLLNELFAVAFRRADWPTALQYAQTVHERMRAKYGDDHATTYVTLLNWGRTLVEIGRSPDAVGKLSQAHEQLTRLLGAASPRTQEAAFLLAQAELILGHTAKAQALIDRLDVAALEAGRSHGLWPFAVDGLRGIALRQRGDLDGAHQLLDRSLEGLKDELQLADPSRLYKMVKEAHAATLKVSSARQAGPSRPITAP